jgi:hypothetical protein
MDPFGKFRVAQNLLVGDKQGTGQPLQPFGPPPLSRGGVSKTRRKTQMFREKQF